MVAVVEVESRRHASRAGCSREELAGGLLLRPFPRCGQGKCHQPCRHCSYEIRNGRQQADKEIAYALDVLQRSCWEAWNRSIEGTSGVL